MVGFRGNRDFLAFHKHAQPAQGPARTRKPPTTSYSLLATIQLWSTERTQLLEEGMRLGIQGWLGLLKR